MGQILYKFQKPASHANSELASKFHAAHRPLDKSQLANGSANPWPECSPCGKIGRRQSSICMNPCCLRKAHCRLSLCSSIQVTPAVLTQSALLHDAHHLPTSRRQKAARTVVALHAVHEGLGLAAARLLQ